MSTPNSTRAMFNDRSPSTRNWKSLADTSARSMLRVVVAVAKRSWSVTIEEVPRKPLNDSRSRPPTWPHLVIDREAVRVLGRIVEADGRRVVARPLDVTAEIALPAGRQDARADLVVTAGEEAAVVGAGVEHVAVRAAVVVEVADVRLEQHAALVEAFRHLERRHALPACRCPANR